MLKEYIRAQYGFFSGSSLFNKSENFYQKILSESKPYIQKGQTVLDIGCAVGRMVFEYEKLGAEKCHGIDTSKVFIDFASRVAKNTASLSYVTKNHSQAQFIHGDFLTADFGDKKYNFVCCINVVDRVTNPQMLVDKIYAVLQDNGVAMLVSPYDWSMSPAPSRHRVKNMKELLEKGHWTIEKEEENIPYTILGESEDVTYLCHMLIVRKADVRFND